MKDVPLRDRQLTNVCYLLLSPDETEKQLFQLVKSGTRTLGLRIASRKSLIRKNEGGGGSLLIWSI